MDTNNQRPANPRGKAAIEASEWRARLPLDGRQKIVNKIIETLKKHLPFSSLELEKLTNIAGRFEEKIYYTATDQIDYLRKISSKMLTIENQNSWPNILSSSFVGRSSKPQDPGVLHNVQPQVNNQGHSLPIPLSVHQSQGCQHLVSQNMQNNIASSGVQSSAGLPSALPTVLSSNQSPFSSVVGQNTDNTDMQNISGILHNSIGNSRRQGVLANDFANQGQMPVKQQVSPQQQQQPTQNSQDCLYQQLMKQKLQQGNLPHTLMQQQQQSSELTNSLDLTAQTTHINRGDWQEDVHQKIKAMKGTYYPELNEWHQKVAAKLQQHESLSQQPNTNQLERLKIFKTVLEQIISFLHVAKINITPGMKDKLDSYEKWIIDFIKTNRPRPRPHIPSLPQEQLPQSHIQPMQQSLSKNPQVLSHESQVSPPLQTMNLQASVPAMRQNYMPVMQHNSVSSLFGIGTSEQMMNAFQPGLDLNSGQGNTLGSLQMLQQQQQQRQQQQQLNRQPKQQLPAYQMPQLGQLTDANQPKLRQSMGVKPRAFQQHLSSDQLAGSPHQQIKSGGSFPISSPQVLPAASSQLPQHSSPQVDRQNLLPSLMNIRTPLQSPNSPFIVPSPSTPLAASPALGDSEKPMPVISSLSNSRNVGHQQTIAGQTTAPSLAINTPSIPASPLLADGAHGITALTTISSKSNVTEQPIERLINAVKSISPEALSASISDIGSMVRITDRIVGTASGNGSRAAVGEDLVAVTNCRLQQINFITQDGMSDTRKMQRYITATPSNVIFSGGSMIDSYKQLTGAEASDLESTAMPSIKRPRFEY